MRFRFATLSLCASAAIFSYLLTGCAANQADTVATATGLTVHGNVHGGQQPVVGAHVYLFAANTTGYGNPAVSLLVPTSTGLSDSVGGYVLTDANGGFTLNGEYSCTATTQVYVYAVGGNPGAGVNSAAGFLAAFGQCPSSGSLAATTPFIYVNEVSTVATAYAMAGYAVDATHVSSSGSALAQTGMANAFANESNLEDIATGAALAVTPAGNGTVPLSTINTLANILASCVNSTGPASAPCTTLFANAKSNGSTGTTATDTATVAINLAHNPGSNVAALFALTTPSPAFSPALATVPNDFTIGINFSGAGSTGSGLNGAYAIAIDAHGDAWFANVNNSSISKLSSNGEAQSPPSGFKVANQAIPTGIAIDLSENAWVADSASNVLTEYGFAGAPLSPAGGFTGGGLNSAQAIAIDGLGNEWVANFGNSSLSEFNSGGAALSPATGFVGGGIQKPTGLAIDAAGNVWVANQSPTPGSISKFTNTGIPITTAAGYTGGGINNPFGVAIDGSGNAWIPNYAGDSISELSSTGVAMSPLTGFVGGGLNHPYSLVIDGGGTIWVANNGNSSVSRFSGSGLAISPATGYTGGTMLSPDAISVDGSGDVWIANTGSTSNAAVTELIGAAVPSARPLAINIKNGVIASRP